MPMRRLSDCDPNLLDLDFVCPKCGRQVGGFWFPLAEGQQHAATLKIGSQLPGADAISADSFQLPAYSDHVGCNLSFEGWVVVEGRCIQRFELETTQPFFHPPDPEKT